MSRRQLDHSLMCHILVYNQKKFLYEPDNVPHAPQRLQLTTIFISLVMYRSIYRPQSQGGGHNLQGHLSHCEDEHNGNSANENAISSGSTAA
jgi:hypothetical protein